MRATDSELVEEETFKKPRFPISLSESTSDLVDGGFKTLRKLSTATMIKSAKIIV